MTERFGTDAGTITIAPGSSTVTGTGTTFGGRDREGALLVALPAGQAPVLVGFVAAVDPRGIYDNLSLPLRKPYNGPALTGVPFVLMDGPAIANGASQAAIYARFAAFLEQNMGLVGNRADTVDMALVPNNSLFVDAVTRTIFQWRNGLLEEVYAVGAAFKARGAWSSATTYARNDLVQYGGGTYVSNADANTNHAPVTAPNPDSDTWWTWLPMPRPGEIFALAFFVNGKPSASELVARYVFVSTVNFDANFVASYCLAKTAATSATVFSLVRVSGGTPTAIGTITFAASSKAGVLSVPDGAVFSAGDVIEIIAPATPDATLADISGTFRGRRDGAAEQAAVPIAGGVQLGGALEPRAWQTIASAATTAIGTVASNLVAITGDATITSFGAAAEGTLRFLRFTGAPTLAYDPAKILLPGGLDILVGPDDTALFVSRGSGLWHCLQYTRAAGVDVLDLAPQLGDRGIAFGPDGAPALIPFTAAGRALVGGGRGADIFRMLGADAAGQNVATAQPWFTASGTLNLTGPGAYLMEGVLRLTRAAGTTSHTTSLLFGGSIAGSADYIAYSRTGDTNALANLQAIFGVDFAEVVVKAASTSATEETLLAIRGVLRVNAGNFTLIPQFKYSAAPGGAPAIKRGTFFHLVPLGTGPGLTVGDWV